MTADNSRGEECQIRKCDKCGLPLAEECICGAGEYLAIGDVCAVEFLDKHVKRHEGAGSVFFQGWGYKHQQMKYKMHHLRAQLAALQAEHEKVKRELDNARLEISTMKMTAGILGANFTNKGSA